MLSGGQGVLPVCSILIIQYFACSCLKWFHFGKLEFICSYILNNFLYGVVSCFSHLINCSIVLKYLSFFDRAWQYLLIYFNTHRAKYLNLV